MANAFATNFPIPATNNVFEVIWKLTRTMKAAGWLYKASGDSTQKDTSGVASQDLWGGSSNPLLDSYPESGASTNLTASTTFPVTAATVTVGSTTGFNAAGGVFYVNGSPTPVTYTSLTPTTFVGCNGGPSLTSSGATVKGLPALLDSVEGWIVLSGPQTLKIHLNSAPTGTPVRGEIVTQLTSGAQGELLGYVWDSVGGSGWAVIAPQLGTWDAFHGFTGGISSAIFTPLLTSTTTAAALPQSSIALTSTTGFPPVGVAEIVTSAGIQAVAYTGISGGALTGCTGGTGNTTNGGAAAPAVVTFNREVMFGKVTGSTVAGYCHYICADPVTEATSLYSYLATQAGCTAALPPGCGGTNNGFNATSPVTTNPMGLCVRGTQIAAGQITAPDNWFGSTTNFGSSAQLGCANTTPGAGVSADGSFYACVSTTTAANYSGFVFTRVDDAEPGDCDPYVFFQTNVLNTVSATPVFSRLATSGTSASAGYSFGVNSLGFSGSTTACFLGYQSRGNTTITRDVPAAYHACVTYSPNAEEPVQGAYPTTKVLACCSPATTPPFIREPLTLVTPGGVAGMSRQIKGRARWMVALSAGNVLDTFDSKTWLTVTPYGAGTPACAIGPYDGATTPST